MGHYRKTIYKSLSIYTIGKYEMCRSKDEIASFQNIWKGGYHEGDPLDPMASSTYGLTGYLSVIHVVYLMCIKPYASEKTRVLEIGPGRGAWTRAILHHSPKNISCVDALSAEHNKFWEYVGNHKAVNYFVANDFSLEMVENNSIDYFFSFGCMCHISPELVEEYIKNLSHKMCSGANGFMMIADYEKANAAVGNMQVLNALRILESIAFWGRRYAPLKLISRMISPQLTAHLRIHDIDEDMIPRPGRWYHMGLARALAVFTRNDFIIINPDMDVLKRDPMIHFQKK
ncbi:MAG: class I SAM-dependent methyltransferase [Methylovulum miyakonense]|uniref:methyltransferase domain-containing protein n=1 Tax=Methylovulum miyakonense TaxID=645578 RepID=UPI003BB61DF7